MTGIAIYLTVNAFILGSLFGSFYSLATYRLPRKQDIFVTNSYCPVCKHNLGFFDLFPVLSFVLHGGKCKYCKCKINPRYLLLEVGNGTLFALAFVVIYFVMGCGFTYTTLYMMIAFATIYTALVLLIGSRIEGKKYEKEQEAE